MRAHETVRGIGRPQKGLSSDDYVTQCVGSRGHKRRPHVMVFDPEQEISHDFMPAATLRFMNEDVRPRSSVCSLGRLKDDRGAIDDSRI
jgi:hypothetical protein